MDQTTKLNHPMNGHVLKVLIDFDTTLDMDFGLIKFIQQNYQDDRAFKLDILNKPDYVIGPLLFSRTDVNPLSIISTEDNFENIDDLYLSFLDNYKKDIMRLSIMYKEINRFLEIITSSASNQGIDARIAINDSLEEASINSRYRGFKFVNKMDIEEILKKEVFYIKDYTIFCNGNLENTLVHKKIYIRPYQYSIDYFASSPKALAHQNDFTIFGTDFRKKEKTNGK